MRKNFFTHISIILILFIFCLVLGCANGPTSPQVKQVATTVSNVAITAQTLAPELDKTYATLVAAKKVPDNSAEASKALAALDAIAPMVQQQGAAIAGDNFNWASFVLQAAMTTAQILTIVL